MSPVPAAFMSYVRRDDQHEYRRLTEFRERLSGEVGLQIGDEFPIFQDSTISPGASNGGSASRNRWIALPSRLQS
jgi:hypothetical protein